MNGNLPHPPRKSAVHRALLRSSYGGFSVDVNTSQSILCWIKGNINKQVLTGDAAADDGQLHKDQLNLDEEFQKAPISTLTEDAGFFMYCEYLHVFSWCGSQCTLAI